MRQLTSRKYGLKDTLQSYLMDSELPMAFALTQASEVFSEALQSDLHYLLQYGGGTILHRVSRGLLRI